MEKGSKNMERYKMTLNINMMLLNMMRGPHADCCSQLFYRMLICRTQSAATCQAVRLPHPLTQG